MLRTQADLAEAVENFEGCSGIVLTKSLVVASRLQHQRLSLPIDPICVGKCVGLQEKLFSLSFAGGWGALGHPMTLPHSLLVSRGLLGMKLRSCSH